MSLHLVTGIGGFIGSSIARALLAQGEKVRGVDNFSTGKRENIDEIRNSIDFCECDILDLQAMHRVCADVDYIFHEAAIPSVPKSVLDPLGSNRANVDGTVNVLVVARDAKVKRIVYAASSSAYGDTPTLPKHEQMKPDPISPYAVSKLAGEHYMTSFYRLLRARNGLPALLQHLWSPPGPVVTLLWRSRQVHYADASQRAAEYLRRRRTEPRFRLYRQRCGSKSARLQSTQERRGRSLQRCNWAPRLAQ